MRRKLTIGIIAFAIALCAVVFTGGVASAHEVRHVGPYTFVVGFLNEPAYAQQQNSVDLTICKGTTCTYTVQDGQRVLKNPVMDADKTLKAEVIRGSAAPLALPLEPRFGNPGKYASYFVPSSTGSYTFHFFGTLEGLKIDEKFTSGPDTFGDVSNLIVYPAATSQNNPNTLQAQVDSARQSAATAMTVGIVGTVLGVLGLLTAGVALWRKPRSASTATASDAEASAKRLDSLRG